MRKGNIELVNAKKGNLQLDKIMKGNVVIWESYNKPYTFNYSDELSSQELHISKTYVLPDGLVTEINAYFRYVHPSNSDCRMVLKLYDENKTELARLVATYYKQEEVNNGDGAFTFAQDNDGNYGSYIKYKFNKPTKLSEIFVSNGSVVGQYQKYGVRGNVQMLIK